MGLLADLLKAIPLSSVLKERLLEEEKKTSILVAEKMALAAENTPLKAQHEVDETKVRDLNLLVELERSRDKTAP